MNLDPMNLFISIVISFIGIGYYSVGKKRGTYFKLTGLAMMFFPYFVDSVAAMLGISIALIILPFVLERFLPL